MKSLQPLTWGFAIYRKMNLDLKDLDGEIWKDIPAYEGLYEASNMGRVKTFRRKIVAILAPVVTPLGYHKVKLYKNRKYKAKFIHRIVLETFIGVRDDMEVDHINHNPSDNRLVSLRYCTLYDNVSLFRKPRNKAGHMGIIDWNGKFSSCFSHNTQKFRTPRKETIEEAIEDFKKRWLEIKGYEFNPQGSPQTLSIPQTP